MRKEREFTRWVACWGNATSITDRKECTYAKNLTLRYPIRMCFDGNRLRFRFSNLTGTESVHIEYACVARQIADYQPLAITFGGKECFSIPAGEEVTSDEVEISVQAGETLDVSFYLSDFTQMNAGTLITGPLSKGKYAYGDYARQKELPLNQTRSTNWFYFLNTIDVLTEEKNHALICYGDSITAQSWPDYLALRAYEQGCRNGLKGATRFPIEMNVAGASAVIIQHGINDIIHPVGVEVNPFRPLSDMPTVEQLQQGVEQIYVYPARQLGLHVWSGTLLPIEGWRTYNQDRESMRVAFNEWLRNSKLFDGCVDFDKAVRNPSHVQAFAEEYDSGDHLHPSELAYKAMAEAVPVSLLK